MTIIIGAIIGWIVGMILGLLILAAIYKMQDIRARRRWQRESQAMMDHFDAVVAYHRARLEALPYLIMEAEQRRKEGL